MDKSNTQISPILNDFVEPNMAPGPKLITAIIPVRLSEDRLYDECERIERIITTLPNEIFDVLIVDYGSSLERGGELRAIANKFGIVLIREDVEHLVFSVGRARDIGTQYATTPLVMYHDIDFLMSAASYRKLVLEARLRDMPNNAYSFFALPGAYLTEEFTERYLDIFSDGDGEYADALLHDGVMRMDKSVFSNMTYAISAIVANRLHLLAIGGHDPTFVGHGAEDFDLLHRLGAHYKRGPRPADYYKNTKDNSITQYLGFRTYFALYGIDVFQRGLILAHLDHPRRRTLGYVGTDNQARIGQAMRDFDSGVSQLPPLSDFSVNENTLVLIKPGSSAYSSLRQVLPLLGRYRIIPEDVFLDGDSITEYVREEGISQVLFLNPYGNTHRLALYNEIKRNNIRYLAFDRGAYPDSWFFDRNGFLAESKSYERSQWDRPLTGDQSDTVAGFIESLRRGTATLEKNGERVGASSLRQQLKIGERKAIVVALQRPQDVATVFFAGPSADVNTFNRWIAELIKSVDPRRFVVVIKGHPLESSRLDFPGAVICPENTNIHDLIDLSDKFVVINSGAGLIAATLGKTVICCGSSFYSHTGFAHQANSPADLISLVNDSSEPKAEVIQRFAYYLTNNFYSFGDTEYLDKQLDGGAALKIAKKIKFSSIRQVVDRVVFCGMPLRGFALDSPLFYSYGGRAAITKKTSSTAASPKNAAATSNVTDIRDKPKSPLNAAILDENRRIRRKILFKGYAGFYSIFLPRSQSQKLKENPFEFFRAAKHPVSKFGKKLFFKNVV